MRALIGKNAVECWIIKWRIKLTWLTYKRRTFLDQCLLDQPLAPPDLSEIDLDDKGWSAETIKSS